MRRRAGVLTMIIAVLATGAAASRGASVREVRVPRAAGGVLGTYARLHSAGLRVSIAGTWTFASSVRVARSAPAPGARIPLGSTVTLYLASPRSIPAAAPQRPVRFPSFLTKPLSSAYTWALAHRLSFRAHLAPLHAGSAPDLLGNYVVTAQRPGRGRAGTGLIVWGRQPAVRPSPPTAPTSGAAPTPSPVSTQAPSPPVGGATDRSGATGPTGASAPTGPTILPAGTYYENPVYSAASFPDPFVLDNGNTHSDYWAFGTGNLFPVLHSTDLVHWTAVGTAMTTKPAWVVASGDWHPWAPSVIQSAQPCPGATSGGCYVMYYVGLNASYQRNCIAVATSENPGGPYTDQGPLGLAGQPGDGSTMPIGCGDANGVGNIDPSPFVDQPSGQVGQTSGQAYLYLSTDNTCSNGTSCSLDPTISVIPLSSDLLEASGPRVPLFSGDPSPSWEDQNVAAPTVEGPSMQFHNGLYYLFYSGGSYVHAYGMGYATSTSPTGPFTKNGSNPFFASTADAFSVGGGDRLVTGPHGGLWMVYHARTSSTSARTLWIDSFQWMPGSTSGAPDVPVVAGPTTTPQSVQP